MSEKRSRRKCAYCGRSTNLTREHVCPDFLDRMMFPNGSFAFIGGANKLVVTQVKIRDVCETCNSGVLAELDSYGKELAASYFQKIVQDVAVRFEYDYDLLLRWLLKVSYNASRAYKSPNQAFKAYIPYIMGEASDPPTTALMVGVWRPSFYRGRLYYPTDVRFSTLVVPDKPYTGLLLARMFTIRSYAFIILGWADQSDPSDISQSITSISEQFGASLLESDARHVFLNPAVSRLDYISHRIAQSHANPWMLSEPSEEMKRLVPKARSIHVSPPPPVRRFYSKVALVTCEEPQVAIFAAESLHPGLVATKQVPIEEFIRVPGNPRASAWITREGQKTYVHIVDHYEIDAPFDTGHIGIHQPEANWKSWQDAIRHNGDRLYISTLSPDNDPSKMRLVSKIRVISIIEETTE